MPRVKGNSPGSESSWRGSQSARSAGVRTGGRCTAAIVLRLSQQRSL